MMREKLALLLVAGQTELKKARSRLNENKKNAEEIAQSAANSPSQSGDRLHAQGQFEISSAYYDRVKIFVEELRWAIDKPVPSRVEPPCYVNITKDGKSMDVFLIGRTILVKGYNIISADSKIGKLIVKKNVGFQRGSVKINEIG